MNLRLALAVPLLACPPVAWAGEISTIFVSNGRVPAGGAAYFDVTVADNPLEITGFVQNSNAPAGDLFSFEVFTTPGTYVGNETDPNVWTSRATGIGTGNGDGDSRDDVVLDNHFLLAANSSYGMAIVLADTSQNRTNGNGANQHYANADIALKLGATSNIAFEGSVFRPRVWNGTIRYDIVDCYGDLDGDRDVDLADLAQLLAHYGTTSGAEYEDGDLDGDGDVDLADVAALLARYGEVCP